MLVFLSIFVALFAIPANSLYLNGSITVDFGNSNHLFNQQCHQIIPMFDRKNYANATFPRPPLNTSDFYLATSRFSCVQSEILEADDLVEAVFKIHNRAPNANALDIEFINANENILAIVTLQLNQTFNWTNVVLSYLPEEDFRIRLFYSPTVAGEFLAIDSVNISVIDTGITTVPPPPLFEDCIRDDFGLNSTGLIYYPCNDTKYDDFVKMQYSNSSLVEKPLGANDFFLTLPLNNKPACMQAPVSATLKEGTEVTFSIFTDNADGKINRAFLIALDAANESVAVNMLPIEINNSRRWRTVSMRMVEQSAVKLKLQIDDLSNSTAFFAIDYIGIRDKDAEDCTRTCQCILTEMACHSRSIRSVDQVASIDDKPSEGYGSASIILMTIVFVSLIWGGIVFVLFFRRRNK